MKWILSSILIAFFLSAAAQVSPSPLEQKHKTILFQGGRAHIGNGEYVNNSSIAIKDGKILFVKNALTYEVNKAEWDTIIDIKGFHIYPGFIAPNVTLGLTEIEAVRATLDFQETGSINPNVRSLTSFNTDSKIIYTVRTNGVLVCQSTPKGGLISGTSSVMALDGWNWEDAVYKKDDGVHVNWPRKYKTSGWWAEPGPGSENKKYPTTRQKIWDFFEEAKAYCQEKKPTNKNLKFEAMRGVFQGTQRLYLHAQFAPEINDIIDFSRYFKFEFPVIVGGYDAHMVADRLKENKFSVMLRKPHQLPIFEDDFPFDPYEKAYKLQQEEVPYCIEASGDMEAMNARNLPFLAGTAWAYGLEEEQAVASISLSTAKILGVDHKIGSLEEGKDATLFVSTGNALDMKENNVVIAMIKGRFVVLDNHQIQLAKKYVKKYGIE